MKKKVTMMILLLCIMQISGFAHGLPYISYTYNLQNEEVSIPAPYSVSDVVDFSSRETGALNEPSQIICRNGKILICDSKNNRVLVFDSSFGFVKEIKSFLYNGKEEKLNNPSGIYMTSDNRIYIADTGNSRIVKLDKNFQAGIIQKPKISVFAKDYSYQPVKVSVDSAGRLYIIASGINRGLICLTPNGEFMNFFGAPKVTANPFELFWKRFLPEEQRKKFNAFVPTEYNSIYIGDKGFIYVTLGALSEKSTVSSVQKLNYAGMNILKANIDGDYIKSEKDTAKSTFVDITVDDLNVMYCLDQRRGRIFAYNDEGSLLYAFGGAGNQKGTFKTAVSLAKNGNELLVLDKGSGYVTRLKLTAFGKDIDNAINLFNNDQFDASVTEWKKVIKQSVFYTVANVGMGKAYYFKKDYSNAIKYLSMAGERYYSAKAFAKQRDLFIKTVLPYFLTFILIAAGLVLLFFMIRSIIRRRNR